jgi:hypothetical protein
MLHSKILKNLLFAAFILFFISACKNNKEDQTRNIQLLSDSTAYQNNINTDSSKLNTSEETSEKATPAASTTRRSRASSSRNSGYSTSGNSGSGTVSNSSTGTTQTTQKKGWSKAAQGAVIGGAAGAVGGAIISKKKGTGAVIGAAVGAAGGYIIGRQKDKKDGRVRK